jgi:phosphatidate cytidylyltransferase
LPFNFQTFKTRALTALLFVAVMLIGLFWNATSFIVLFTIIHFGCWFEFVKLMKKIYPAKYLLYSLSGLLYITLPVLMIIEFRLEYLSVTANIEIDEWRFVVMPCFIIFCMWVNDTMAYLVGSFIGKTPFSKISPKKTWEGTIGGIILCAVVMGFAGKSLGRNYFTNNTHYFICAFIASVMGTLGDLFESKLKRMAGVKDSGSFMPGHGGFLDRFDSLLFAIPAVWLYIQFIVK